MQASRDINYILKSLKMLGAYTIVEHLHFAHYFIAIIGGLQLNPTILVSHMHFKMKIH